MSRPLLMLFDGHGLAFRAFYGMPELRNSKGEVVHAILGVTQMVLRMLDEHRPEFAAVSFDRGRPAFRTEAFPGYKGQREHAPEGLGWQFPWIEQMVEALRLPIYSVPGFEADDCIGTISHRAELDGMDVAIVSGDLDMLQLVTPHIRVLAALRNVKEPVAYDLAAVRERFSIEPERLPDWKALAGDSSDNIPGVEGIGKDSATKLLVQFGSVEGLLAHSAEVPAKYQKKLEGHDEDMRRYRDIATIVTTVDLPIQWGDCHRQPWDAERFGGLCDRLELHALKKRLGLPGAADTDTDTASPESEGAALVEVTIECPRLVPESVTLGALAAAWPTDRWVPLHVGTGTITIAVGNRALTAETGPEALVTLLPGRQVVVPHLKPLLRAIGSSLLKRDSVRVFDLAIASYLLHAGLTAHTLDAALRRMGLDALLPVETPQDAVSAMTAALPIFESALHNRGLQAIMDDLEVPVAWPLAAMEEEGMTVNQPYLQTLGIELDSRIASLKAAIYEAAGVEFNLNSPKQVGDVLFERLKLPGAKKTKTGYATGVEILAELAATAPIAALMLQYREVSKLKSTYVDTLPEQLREGKVHTTFNQTVAATGRLSSSDPNLQNIPIRSELGRLVRSTFIPSMPGRVLVAADYSQIELRILAHVSQDERLLQAFRDDEDIHAATAAQVFNLPLAEVTSDVRRRAKEINFGILYGMSAHGLAQRLNIGRKEAQTFIEQYLDRFAGVRNYLREAVQEAEQQGWVSTLQGRRRTIPDINSRNMTVKKGAERMAINAPIQGTAADFIKKAMVRVYDELASGRMPGHLLLQVHDELLLEVEAGQAEVVGKQVQTLMAQVFALDVPLKVDVSYGTTWADMHRTLNSETAPSTGPAAEPSQAAPTVLSGQLSLF